LSTRNKKLSADDIFSSAAEAEGTEVSRAKRPKTIPEAKGLLLVGVVSNGPSVQQRESVASSLCKAMEREGASAEVLSKAALLESGLFAAFPSLQGHKGFSPDYLSQMRMLLANARGLVHVLAQPGVDVAKVAKALPGELLTPAEAEKEAKEHLDAVHEMQTEQDRSKCTICGKLQMSRGLNVNLMGDLEENNMWRNMFEEDPCTCDQKDPTT